MPPSSKTRLNNIISYLTLGIGTLEDVSDRFGTPFLLAISSTTLSLLTVAQRIKRNKAECAQLMEHVHQIIYAIIDLHLKSEPRGELPPAMLHYIGKFAETLQKIHMFAEAQQDGNTLKRFFRQSEITQLLKDCNQSLQETFEIFKCNSNIQLFNDIQDMQRMIHKQQQELLDLIETLSDGTSSDKVSSIIGDLGNSSSSLALLPAKPKIFHGRDSEMQQIINMLDHEAPRIAILGAGGIGKTSLARTALHCPTTAARYECRLFVGCESATTSIEVAALVGAHIGLKPGTDLTQPVVSYLSNGPPCLLVLDNLETSWEPKNSRSNVEELLSLLADIHHLALIITMRGAERPAKVSWTRPFLAPLNPLAYEAAYQTFIDIADDFHNNEEINNLLLLTDNLPLAVNLIAHLVHYEDCGTVLARWEKEKTSILSTGYNRLSSLDLSLTLSLSSPRITCLPGTKELLSLLSLLPDGLSDVVLFQSNLSIPDISACRTALLRTSLAYIDHKKQLTLLAPVREYIYDLYPPFRALIRPLQKHFFQLLQFYYKYGGQLADGRPVAQIKLHLANLQNILLQGFQGNDDDLGETVLCAIYLNDFSRRCAYGRHPLMDHIPQVLSRLADHKLEIAFITETVASWMYKDISDPQSLLKQALEHFRHLNDPVLEARFYHCIGHFYVYHENDSDTSNNFFETGLALSRSCGAVKEQCANLSDIALVKWRIGDYSGSQCDAREIQKLAHWSGDLFEEAKGAHLEAMSCTALSHYQCSIVLCQRARELLGLCGMSGETFHSAICEEAQVHLLKSEYSEALAIHTQVLSQLSMEQDAASYAFSLLNIAEIEVIIGTSSLNVHQNLNQAKALFEAVGYPVGILMHDMIFADLNLREGDTLLAKELFLNLVNGTNIEIVAYCLERLADVTRWPPADIDWSCIWPILFLGYAMKLQNKRAIYKALQSLGDICFAQEDEDTAVSLFTVALQGFTQMDIHQSRGDCMLRLGNLAEKRGEKKMAAEFWTAARPLFERSLQVNQVTEIDAKIATK
ncbi:hypothetical protein FB451DRAFT_1126899 [Mycena latifolia]|nr:hypothetical protein FB451DRAFT_1126899 [Mycena latifolia]